eukprot:528206-Rhodomonas_salina.1
MPGTDLRAPYAMPGTELGYGTDASRVLAPASPYAPLSAYALPTRCPVLTHCMAISPYVISGTELAHALLSPYALPTRCPLAICLRAAYAMSGTDLAYAATRCAVRLPQIRKAAGRYECDPPQLSALRLTSSTKCTERARFAFDPALAYCQARCRTALAYCALLSAYVLLMQCPGLTAPTATVLANTPPVSTAFRHDPRTRCTASDVDAYNGALLDTCQTCVRPGTCPHPEIKHKRPHFQYNLYHECRIVVSAYDISYVMSGTDLAYYGIRLRYLVLAYGSALVSAYARPMRCPVLTQRMVRPADLVALDKSISTVSDL